MNFLRAFNFRRRSRGRPAYDYEADGLAVLGHNLDFMSEPRFMAAWEATCAASRAWKKNVPDIRWRFKIAIGAAQQSLLTDGDFVECGVNSGILSVGLCHYLDFTKIDRKFFLFDTYNGIPTESLNGPEREMAEAMNRKLYFDIYDATCRNFAPWPNAKLVRGELPGTLDAVTGPIAYLSIDLNSATFERQVIERLWDQVSPGGTILLDDYGWRGHEETYASWNDFAAKVGHPIFLLPTGQGLIVRSCR